MVLDFGSSGYCHRSFFVGRRRQIERWRKSLKRSIFRKKDTAESTKESETAEFYNVGDSVKVGDATYTLTSVSLTDERNQFDETNPAYVIAVSYTMENNSDEDLPVGMDLSAYGPDDKKLESYPNDNTMGSVAAGKKMDCVEHFGLGELGEVELQFAPAISLEKTANFKANVQ